MVNKGSSFGDFVTLSTYIRTHSTIFAALMVVSNVITQVELEGRIQVENYVQNLNSNLFCNLISISYPLR